MSAAAKNGAIFGGDGGDWSPAFQLESFLMGCIVQNGPEFVKGTTLYALRILDGEDRSEIIKEEGTALVRCPKWRPNSGSFLAG